MYHVEITLVVFREKEIQKIKRLSRELNHIKTL